MRWLYYNDHNLQEAAEREAVTAKIDTWWRAFEGQVQSLESLFKRETKWGLPQWMYDNLHAIDPRIMWEYGPAVNANGHRLVLTPESARELRPLVAKILERAPVISGWEFYDARLPEDLETTKSAVEGRTSHDISNFLVRPSIGDGRLIDLCYYSPHINGNKDEKAFNAAFVATETLLGERRLDRWIGEIEISPFPTSTGLKSFVSRSREAPRHAIKLDRLNGTVEAAVESIRDQLPPTPHYRWVHEAKWTLWELKPDPADDFPHQADLFVGKSANPTMWTTAHSRGAFYSERFTRCDETFCYVKIDGSEGFSDSSFSDKSDIEDAIDETLIPRKLGCHIGGGTGLRYSYIDLALTDIPAAITAIRDRLRVGSIPKRSWILFFDADLATEWVGIYDDTPPPQLLDSVV